MPFRPINRLERGVFKLTRFGIPRSGGCRFNNTRRNAGTEPDRAISPLSYPHPSWNAQLPASTRSVIQARWPLPRREYPPRSGQSYTERTGFTMRAAENRDLQSGHRVRRAAPECQDFRRGAGHISIASLETISVFGWTTLKPTSAPDHRGRQWRRPQNGCLPPW